MTANDSGRRWKSLFGRFAAMIVVTLFAGAVMLASSTKWFPAMLTGGASEEPAEAPPTPEAAPTAVSIQIAQRQPVEIMDAYSGMIKPLERFSLAFEISGRIAELGVDGGGRELDEGARVAAGQMLAKLDTRAAEAMVQESQARYDQKLDDLQRAEELQRRNPAGVSDSQLVTRRAEVAIAEAQLDLTKKNLLDSTLRAPVDGVISKRLLKTGESVNVHQPVFELVQVDQVLLVVGVPEARIGPIIARQREVRANNEAAPPMVSDDSNGTPIHLRNDAFQVYVDLIGQDSLGRQWDTMLGEVRTVSQTSDERSGLFEVEILLDNPEHLIRPGRIGMARLVVKTVDAFRLPVSSTVVQDDTLFLYSLQPQETAVRLLFWEVGEAPELTAARFPLPEGGYVEQGDELIVFDLPEEHRTVVVRGQHRLLPGVRARVAAAVQPPSPKRPAEAGSANQ